MFRSSGATFHDGRGFYKHSVPPGPPATLFEQHTFTSHVSIKPEELSAEVRTENPAPIVSIMEAKVRWEAKKERVSSIRMRTASPRAAIAPGHESNAKPWVDSITTVVVTAI